MGTAVDLKVEEEVAKKKLAMDAQLKAMEDKFARENEALRQELAKADPSAANSARLKQMDSRKRAMESYKARVKIHLSEYKRELMRLEEGLKRVLPAVSEANLLAHSLGRIVRFDAALITQIPQAMAFSPVEELLTQKVTDLMVRCVLHNPRTDEQRDWFWGAEAFFDRLGHMRNAWQEWMLKSIPMEMHSSSDPFWSQPAGQMIGSSYLYLAPVAYGVPVSEWIPIVNYRGESLTLTLTLTLTACTCA